MNILFLTPQLPYPPHQGTSLRNYGLLKGLSERNQVSLLSFVDAERCVANQNHASQVPGPLQAICQRIEVVPMPPARSLARRGLDTFTRRLPDMALRLASPAFTERLTGWLLRERFDVIHVEGIEMARYLGVWSRTLVSGSHARAQPGGDGLSRDDAPVVVFDDHNCEYMLQKSYARVDAGIPLRWPGAIYSLIQWQKLRAYEAKVCRRAHHVLAVSQMDAEALQRSVPGLKVTVIPNGIETDAYESGAGEAVPEMDGDQPSVVFTGKMDFRPNVDAVRWFADLIWPRVRAAVPEAHFYAVGQQPHPQLDYLRADASITLTGWVEDVRPFVSAAKVYVAPLRMGSGTRLKLLQAMAMGKAIVGTRMAAEGLTDDQARYTLTADADAGRVTQDQELVLVDDNDPVGFADATVALLRDPHRRARLGASARTFVRAHYDWAVIIPRLEALYARD